METFHGFDFDTMTETGPAAAESCAGLSIGVGEDVSFVRGVVFALAFSVPAWLALAGALRALLG